jgi:tRNA threonylcarbamoyl adenosine modification protein (Sua5/YciO/YrdC/YwlC family)
MVAVSGEFETPIREQTRLLREGGVIGLATDTTYALVAALTSRKGVERLRDMRHLPPSKPLSLLIRNLTDISRYAYIDRIGYRLVKRLTPGRFTFVLRATKDVPRLTLTNQRTVGIRICGVSIVDALCESLGEPLISASAVITGGGYAETADELAAEYPQANAVLDGGTHLAEVSTLIDLTGPTPQVLRTGSGDTKAVFVEG